MLGHAIPRTSEKRLPMIDFKAIPVFSELLNRTSHLFYRIIRRNAVSRFWPENAVGKK